MRIDRRGTAISGLSGRCGAVKNLRTRRANITIAKSAYSSRIGLAAAALNVTSIFPAGELAARLNITIQTRETQGNKGINSLARKGEASRYGYASRICSRRSFSMDRRKLASRGP
jgi:hypothetical protein